MYKSKSNRSNVQTIVPLDALLKEKENTTSKPTAIRSAGKVGKWGVTSFTSIRTAYSLGLQHQKDFKPPPNEVVSKSEEESETVEAPKPRKFFKSRASIQAQTQQSPLRQSIDAQPTPHVSTKSGNSTTNRQQATLVNNDSFSTTVNTTTTKQNKGEKKIKKTKLKPEIKPERAPERTSARNRNKCVNYNEDDAASISSVAVTELRLAPETNGSLSKQESAPKQIIEENPPSPVHPLVEPIVEPEPIIPEQPPVEHPKIVLRISKGTARFVDTSTSEEETPLINKIKLASPEKLNSVKKTKKRKNSKMDVDLPEELPPPPPPPPAEETPVLDELEQQLAEIVHEPIEVPPPVREPTPEPAPNKRSLRTRTTAAKKEKVVAVKEPSPEKPVSPVKPSPVPAVDVTNKTPNKRKAAASKKVTPVKKSPEKPAPVVATRATRATRKRRGTSPTTVTETPKITQKSPEKAVPAAAVPEKKRHIEEKPTPVPPTSNVKSARSKVPATVIPAEPESEPIPSNAVPATESSVPPSVKLVISKKKGSIFKSRALVNETGNKRHVYKHKWEDDDKEKAVEKSPEPPTKKPVVTGNHSSILDEFDDFDGPSTVDHSKKSVAKSLAEEFADEKDAVEPVKGRKV